MRLPTEGELLACERRYEVEVPNAEWVGPAYVVIGSLFEQISLPVRDPGI